MAPIRHMTNTAISWVASIGVELLAWYLIKTSRKAMEWNAKRVQAWERDDTVGLPYYIRNHERAWGRYQRVLPIYQRLREIEDGTSD